MHRLGFRGGVATILNLMLEAGLIDGFKHVRENNN